MDNLSRQTRVAFGPARWLVLITGLAAIVLVGLAVGTDDRAGRLLYALAALAALATALQGLLVTPRLVVATAGLDVRTSWTARHLDWSQITHTRLDDRRRLGLARAVLEIDAEETLYVLTRWDLGVDPVAAAAVIDATRPTSLERPDRPNS